MKEWMIPSLALLAWSVSPANIPAGAPQSVVVFKDVIKNAREDAREERNPVAPRTEPTYPEAVFKSLREFLVLEFSSSADRGRFSITGDETGGQVVIRLSAAFAAGSAEVVDPIPKTIARILRLAHDPVRVDLEIYADPAEARSATEQWQLSLARAQTLWRSLNESAVDMHLLALSARGAESPIEAETDEASRARNRRVEIKIHY